MPKKLLIVQAAALAHECRIEGLQSHWIQSVFPAVTCTVQASFRTALLPREYGIIANGLFFRTLRKPLFWEQSARLVQGERIWDEFRSRGKRVAMLFWQQSLGENVDILLSPAPIHKHGGGMIQTCYSKPHNLYEKLCKQLGRPFRLKHYWGPMASEKVGDWIEEATLTIIEAPALSPDLCMTYLPTLDYTLQRENPGEGKKIVRAKARLESQVSRLVQKATSLGYRILIYGDYRMAPVDGAVLPNLALRQAGLLRVRAVNKMTYPDMYGSRAFSMVDHQIAHVYISDEKDIPRAKATLESLPGVNEVLDHKGQAEVGLDHQRSGELLAIAREGKWFAYPWWTQMREAPDYAGHVDIHNKPGYDPCELFFGWPPGSVSHNPERVRGSHGRVWGLGVRSSARPISPLRKNRRI